MSMTSLLTMTTITAANIIMTMYMTAAAMSGWMSLPCGFATLSLSKRRLEVLPEARSAPFILEKHG